MKMYCVTNQFPDLKCFGSHKKPHGVFGFVNNYNMSFDTKLGYGTCAIRLISCVCPPCTYTIDQTWNPSVTVQLQSHHQPVKDCKYWHLLGYFKNWNIIQLSHKETRSEEIHKINQVVLDGISDNMTALAQTGKNGTINTTYATKMEYYVIKFISESYTLQ